VQYLIQYKKDRNKEIVQLETNLNKAQIICKNLQKKQNIKQAKNKV